MPAPVGLRLFAAFLLSAAADAAVAQDPVKISRLSSGRYSLLGPDSHRLDRTSLRLAHSLNDLFGAGE
ncbi:MAG: hypothetical protein C5B56_08460 [Proteobacteria bacterium]|nr:MAG: hypothetical protein C5B56_08460 [Pseudomonadota bacterium]